MKDKMKKTDIKMQQDTNEDKRKENRTFLKSKIMKEDEINATK